MHAFNSVYCDGAPPEQIPPLELALLVHELGGPGVTELLFRVSAGSARYMWLAAEGAVFRSALSDGANRPEWRVYGVRNRERTVLGNPAPTETINEED